MPPEGWPRRRLLTSAWAGPLAAALGGRGREQATPAAPIHRHEGGRALTELCGAELPARAAVVDRFAGREPAWFGLEGPGIVSSVDPDEGAVLTLDACGGSRLELDDALIGVLRRTGTPATLFVNRSWALANPLALRDLAADPLLEIANHGDRHVPLSVTGASAYGIGGTRDVGEVFDEVARCHRLLRLLWGVRSRWFRPGTAHADDVAADVAAALGTPVVGFTVNGDHGATASADEVTEQLLTLRPGGIVLAHMNRPGSGTAAGLERALPELRARGLRLRRLGDALRAGA